MNMKDKAGQVDGEYMGFEEALDKVPYKLLLINGEDMGCHFLF